MYVQPRQGSLNIGSDAWISSEGGKRRFHAIEGQSAKARALAQLLWAVALLAATMLRGIDAQ